MTKEIKDKIDLSVWQKVVIYDEDKGDAVLRMIDDELVIITDRDVEVKEM